MHTLSRWTERAPQRAPRLALPVLRSGLLGGIFVASTRDLTQVQERQDGADLRALYGRKVKLNFEVKEAILYAYRFAGNGAGKRQPLAGSPAAGLLKGLHELAEGATPVRCRR
jgi:hypothetical protein